MDGVIPGSRLENRIVDDFSIRLREHVDQVYKIDVPLYTWIHDCSIEVKQEHYPCIHLPYSRLDEISFDQSDVIALPEIRSLEDIANSIRGKIVLLPYPRDQYLTRLYSVILARGDARAIVYYSTQDNIVRAGIVHSSMKIDYSPSMPLDIPVVSIDRITMERLLKTGGTLRAMSRLAESMGKIVLGYVNGVGERSIHILSHHDSLINPRYQSSLIILETLAGKTRELNMKHNIVLISYTARELGDIEFTSYHYTWGERYLLRVLANRGDLEKLDYAVAIGPLFGKGDLLVKGHDFLLEQIRQYGVKVNTNYVFSEAYSYIEQGIPSIVVMEAYSDLFRNTNITIDHDEFTIQARKVIDLVVDFITHFSIDQSSLNKYRQKLLESISDLELEERVLFSRTWDLRVLIDDPWLFIKSYTKLAHGVFHILCLDQVIVDYYASLWVSISPERIETIKKIGRECNHELIINTGNLSIDIVKPSSEFIESLERLISRHVINYLNSKLDEVISNTICKDLTRRVSYVEKSNRDRQVQ